MKTQTSNTTSAQFVPAAVYMGRRIVKSNHSRSSRPEVFFKKGALTKFAKFTGKHLCQSLFFNKVAGLRPATLLKKGPDIGILL